MAQAATHQHDDGDPDATEPDRTSAGTSAGPTDADAGRGRTARRTPAARAALAVGALASWLLVLAVHGFLPGSSQVPLEALFGTGAIQCLHDQGIASLWTWCMSLGLPVGAPRLTGLPQVYTGWAVSFLPGVDAWTAHQLSQGLFDTIGLVGGYLLLRRWGVAWGIALPAVVAYLVAPNVIVLNGFPYTMIGYLLLPALALVVLRTLDRLDRGRPSDAVRAVLGAVGASLVLVFTDGYAFFGGALAGAVLACGWAWRRARAGHRSRALGGLLLWAGSLGGAALLYAVWVPSDAYSTDVPLEYFGLLGVDVVTLLVPSVHFAWPALVGLEPPTLRIWGIADTLPTNYLGYVALGLGVVAFVLLRRGARRAASEPGTAPDAPPVDVVPPEPVRDEPDVPARRAELGALAVAGFVALVLSLGPTLKVGQVDPGLAASLVDLPTRWLYENVPGISEMRATNRWLIVTRFAVLALAAVGLDLLWRAARHHPPAWRVAVVLLGVVAVLEVAPAPGAVVRQRQASVAKVGELRDGVVAEADALLRDGETVLVLPSVNDFLAMYLVPMVGVESYNVGGDKNYYLALDRWPEDVRLARDNYGPLGAGHLCNALDASVDAIVLPYADPYAAPLLRRPDVDADRAREELARDLAQDPRFDAAVGERLTVLRRGDADCVPAG